MLPFVIAIGGEERVSVIERQPLAARPFDAPRFALVAGAVWAAIALALILSHRPVADFMSTDDLMRLVEIRGLIAGQGWFDLVQHRLDPPGLPMHWSRLVDLPFAAAMMALAPALGAAAAETVVATLFPVLLLFLVLIAAAKLAQRLGGETARVPALLLLAIATPVLVHVRPGALDHHGIQIVLLLAAALLATAPVRRRDSVLAGLMAALSLAIGLETLPALAALLGALGLRWVFGGKRDAIAAADAGAGLAVASVVLFFATVPRAAWTSPVCDALSIVWLAAAALAGGALVLLPALSALVRSAPAKAAAGLALAATACGLLFVVFPQCVSDPYGALDPRLATLWLAHVMEAQSLVQMARLMPEQVAPLYAPPLIALALGTVVLVRADARTRRAFLPALCVVAALFAVAIWQMRGAAAAIALAAPVIAASLVVLARGEGLPRAAVLGLIVLASNPALTMLGQGVGRAAAWFDPAHPVVTNDGSRACRRPEDFAALAAHPHGVVLSMIDIGPAILAHTPHAILAAPYHRNSNGNLAALKALLGDDAAAQQVLRDRRIAYVALCDTAPERNTYAQAAANGLLARLVRGETPAYLEPLPRGGGNLLVYRVKP